MKEYTFKDGTSAPEALIISTLMNLRLLADDNYNPNLLKIPLMAEIKRLANNPSYRLSNPYYAVILRNFYLLNDKFKMDPEIANIVDHCLKFNGENYKIKDPMRKGR